jgi:drug/metabolite transporter (DMT)-like permease
MAVVVALLSALAYAGASVLQQRAAREVPEEHALRVGLLWRLVRRPMWLLGTALDWTGFGLQALALGLGSLLVVEPILCTGLLFALPVGVHWSGRRLSRRDWIAAVGLTVALAVFLIVGAPTSGQDFASDRAWIIAGAILGPVIAVATVASMRVRGTARAVLLALATAMLYAVTAVITKAAVTLLGEGIGHLLTSWELYVGIVAGFLGLVLNQSAFQAGELRASLPILTVVEPVVAAILGVTMLHEAISASGVISWALVVASVLAMIWAIVSLAQSAARSEQPVVHHP